jgi:hypothetical protein
LNFERDIKLFLKNIQRVEGPTSENDWARVLISQ